MYRMTSFIVTGGSVEAYEFFFGLSTLESALHSARLDRGELIEEALRVIKSKLDEGGLTGGMQCVYEYNFEGTSLQFKLVDNPVWMTKNPR